MKVLLIGGAPSTGKSNAVAMCANYFVGKGFKLIDCQDYDGKQIKLPKVVIGDKYPTDFLAKLEGKDSNNKIISVILTSASDTSGMIDINFNYLQNQKCVIYISSIRDIDYERKYLLKKFNFTNEASVLLEIPLAKMSRRNPNWYTAKAWYDITVQNILSHILNTKPFEV